MLKPNTLYNALTDAVPELLVTPAKLQVYVESGSVVATLAASLSYEKRYPLVVTVTGFTGELDALLVPVMAWLRVNQPDIMMRYDPRQPGFAWQTAPNPEGGTDVRLALQLTERTRVYEANGALYAENLPEPVEPDAVTRPLELYINGERVSRWQETF